MRLILLLTLCMAWHALGHAQMANHWRGPARNGYYPERGLLREWPPDGPELIWAFEGLGAGFSSPAVANDRIYVSGMENGVGYIYILSPDGQLLSQFPYGPEFPYRYPGSRTSPTVVGNLLYMVSAYARLVCMDVHTGQIKWAKEYYTAFQADSMYWGYTENIVVYGDLLFAAPGGREHNVVALNRFTGDLVWSSPGIGRGAAYCSPLLFEHNSRMILATIMAGNIQGHDAATGQLLWHAPFSNQWQIHPNTPIYHEGGLLFFTGYGGGAAKFQLSADGASIQRVWEAPTFDVQMEGAVLHNGVVYGAGHNNRFWFAVDWDTGQIRWRDRILGKGSPILADGLLFIYTERGELALAEPTEQGLVVRSRTTVTLGTHQHFAHPVLHNGRLYVRRGNALMAYRVR